MPIITARVSGSAKAIRAEATSRARNALAAAIAYAGDRAETIYRRHRERDLRRTERDQRVIRRTLASLRVVVRVQGYNISIIERVAYGISRRRALAIDRARRHAARDLTRLIQSRFTYNLRNLPA